MVVMSQPDTIMLDRRDLPEYITAMVVIIISLGLYAFIKLTGKNPDQIDLETAIDMMEREKEIRLPF